MSLEKPHKRLGAEFFLNKRRFTLADTLTTRDIPKEHIRGVQSGECCAGKKFEISRENRKTRFSSEPLRSKEGERQKQTRWKRARRFLGGVWQSTVDYGKDFGHALVHGNWFEKVTAVLSGVCVVVGAVLIPYPFWFTPLIIADSTYFIPTMGVFWLGVGALLSSLSTHRLNKRTWKIAGDAWDGFKKTMVATYKFFRQLG